jgi:exopolysaccharide production protein ExoQ
MPRNAKVAYGNFLFVGYVISCLALAAGGRPSVSLTFASLLFVSIFFVPTKLPFQLSAPMRFVVFLLVSSLVLGGISIEQERWGALTTLLLVLLMARLRRIWPKSLILRVVTLALVCTVAASLALGIFFPEIGIVQTGYEAGSLTGFFTHRNLLGMVAGATSTLLIAGYQAKNLSAFFTFGGLLFSLPALVMSRSMSSIFAFVIALVATQIWFRGKREEKSKQKINFRGTTVLLLVAIAMVTFFYLPGPFQLIGRDETLTGRTQIWSVLISKSDQFWLWGVGWDRAWTELDPVSSQIRADLGFFVAHAHSAVLDMIYRLGLPAILVVTIVSILNWRSFKLPKGQLAKTQDKNFTKIVVIFLVALGTSESFLHLNWFPLVLLTLLPAKEQDQSAKP